MNLKAILHKMRTDKRASALAWCALAACVAGGLCLCARLAGGPAPPAFPAFPAGYSVPERRLSEPEAAALRARLRRLNKQDAEILNWRRFGPVTRDTPVLLVEVHRAAARLQLLLASLARVRDIHTALLVLSHSYYDEAIVRLGRGVRFCMVAQIFYPHSVQLHPTHHPGVDPADCPPGASPSAGAGCRSRDARRVERKLHWWWKASFAFERADWAPGHRAPVAFLEEHQLAAPDLLHMLRHAERALARFPAAVAISLGRAPEPALGPACDLLAVDAWRPPECAGLALNATAWRRLAALAVHYCTHDDVSWEASLTAAGAQLPGGRAAAVSCAVPRLVPQGGEAERAMLEAERGGALFPARVRAVHVWGAPEPAAERPPPPTGGWADLRDQLLCLDPFAADEAEAHADAEAV